jgi:hypothetical protein
MVEVWRAADDKINRAAIYPGENAVFARGNSWR